MRTAKSVFVILVVLSLFVFMPTARASSLNSFDTTSFEQMKQELSLEPPTLLQSFDREIRDWNLRSLYGPGGLTSQYIDQIKPDLDPAEHPILTWTGALLDSELGDLLTYCHPALSVLGAGGPFFDTLRLGGICTQIISPIYLDKGTVDIWSGMSSWSGKPPSLDLKIGDLKIATVDFENYFRVDQSGLVTSTQIARARDNDMIKYYNKVEINTPSTSIIDKYLAGFNPALIYDPETSTVSTISRLEEHYNLETNGGLTQIKPIQPSISWKDFSIPWNSYDSLNSPLNTYNSFGTPLSPYSTPLSPYSTPLSPYSTPWNSFP